jgi:PEP-CTERM motif
MKIWCTLTAAVFITASLVGADKATANTILETAALTPRTGCCGEVSIFSGNYQAYGNPQWLGARFQISEKTDITGIGGLMELGQGTLFGAIVQISSGTALPSGSPFNAGEVAFETTLENVPTTDPNLTTDFVQSVSVTLEPGWYALIFGSGDFGTTGFGGMNQAWDPTTGYNLDLPGASYIDYSNGIYPGQPAFWANADFHGTRFLVYGTPIPEPSTWAMMLLGFVGFGAAAYRSTRRTTAGGRAQDPDHQAVT